MDASFTRAGNEAFGVLVGFIPGRNSTRGKVAMTAPVRAGAGAHHDRDDRTRGPAAGAESGRHVVAFVMPAEYTLETLPTPSDPRIQVRQVPAQVAAAKGFAGRWTEQIYQRKLAGLRTAVEQAGLEVDGAPRFARFDPPWTPWFRRRNEVVLPVLWLPQVSRKD